MDIYHCLGKNISSGHSFLKSYVWGAFLALLSLAIPKQCVFFPYRNIRGLPFPRHPLSWQAEASAIFHMASSTENALFLFLQMISSHFPP